MPNQNRVALFVENVLNDPDMEHLKLRDLKNFVLHMQNIVFAEETPEEDEDDADLRQHVL